MPDCPADRPRLLAGPRGRAAALALLVLAGWALGGCATVRVTDPDRTATEQMLLSEAAENAVAKLAAEPLRDRLVFIDTQFYDSTDSAFVLGELRAHLLERGVRLAETQDAAEVILEVRSGGVGIDRYNYLLGLPPIFLPAGNDVGGVDVNTGTVITPELAIMKRIRQLGFASVGFVAYWKDSGELLVSSGPAIGRTRRVDWWFFGMGPKTSGDIPPAETEQ